MPEKTGTGVAKSSPLATARLNFETNSLLESRTGTSLPFTPTTGGRLRSCNRFIGRIKHWMGAPVQ